MSDAAGRDEMHAIVMHERGGPEVLRYERFPRPVPGPGEVLLRVHAATVNHTDIFHREGRFFLQKGLPHVLGMDVAGVVDAAGEGVSGWRPGDRAVAAFEALGRERNGAYAEYTTVPAEQLRRVPDGLDLVAAATVGLAFTTAWIALFYRAGLREREQVVIQAASSGVGLSALQIARWKRARVIAVTESSKVAALKDLGADVVVDREAADLTEQLRAATDAAGASLVVDLVGCATLRHSVGALADRGRVVCVGTLSGDVAELDVMELMMKNGTVLGSFGVIEPGDFERILELFADGTFRPVIDSVLPLSRAREAHERIEAKQAFGKVVLVPDALHEAG